MRNFSLLGCLPLAFFLTSSACANAPPNTGTVVVGITSELRAGVDIAELDTVMRVNGSVVKQDAFQGAALTFPMELAFGNLKDEYAVEAELSAVSPLGDPLVKRSART